VITGEIKNQVDKVWDTFWSGGVSSPLSVIEQVAGIFGDEDGKTVIEAIREINGNADVV